MKGSTKKEFDKSLDLTRIAFLLSGIELRLMEWGKGVGCSINSWLYCFNFIWLYIDVFGIIYWTIDGFQMGKSFDEISLGIPCAVINFIGTSKSAYLYFNRHQLQNVIQKLRDIHPHYDDSDVGNIDVDKEVEIKIEEETRKYLNAVIKFLFYTFGSVLLGFSTTPVFSMMCDLWLTGSTELKTPFPIKYLFDPSRSYYLFLPVYFHQMYSSFLCAINVFGSDTFLYAFCTYLKMHFRILCYRFENVVSKSETKTRENFRKAVRRHQTLIQLVDEVQLLYSKSMLFNIMISPLIICLSAFNITFGGDAETVITFVLFLIMNLFQTFLFCFFGDLLMAASGEVSDAVYRCEWYNADNDTKRNVLIVMVRAQEPCKLTAMEFADLNLTTFTAILSRSWSCFALLQTMYQ